MIGKKKKLASIQRSEEKKEDIDIEEINQEDVAQHLDLVKDILENTQTNIKKALALLREKNINSQSLLDSLKEAKESSEGFVGNGDGSERIIEGVFDGEKVIANDGVEFNVPVNYASKSKLVEGDIMKLTITRDGSFIYKQIGPVERKQMVATLVSDDTTHDWYAVEGNQRWKLLTASVTYFHGSAGDEVVILVPRDGSTKWAAVENIIKKNNH